jgi:hypothetical protein
LTIRQLFGFWCEFPGCKTWNGALYPYPAEDQAGIDKQLREQGWGRNPDLCPKHLGAFTPGTKDELDEYVREALKDPGFRIAYEAADIPEQH